MTGLGTDVVAVACILGGAAVSGATTMAVVGGHRDHVDMACVQTVNVRPRVVVSMDGGKGTVLVTPHVWMHGSHDCGLVSVKVRRDVRVNTDQVRAQLERARAQMERARAQMERARAQVQVASPSVDQAAFSADLSAQIQKQIQAQMKQLDEELAKLDGGTGR